jgi:O-antigen/teichoic acid export membrane protein
MTAAGALSALCGLFTVVLNSRALGAEGFGVLSLIVTYSALFSGIATFDIWQPVVRLGVRAPRLLGLTLSAGIALDVVAAIVGTLAALGGTIVFGAWIGVGDDQLWLVQLHALTLLTGISGTPKGYFRLRERFAILAGNQIMLALAMTLTSAVLWWTAAPLLSYVAMFSVIAACYNLTLVLRMLLALRRDGVRLEFPLARSGGRRILGVMLRTALGTSFVSTLTSSRRPLSLLLVGALLGSREAGILSAAASMSAAVSRLSSILMQVVFKVVLDAADNYPPRVWREKVWTATQISSIAAAMLALAGSFAGPYGIHVLLGDVYAPSALVFVGLFAAECAVLATLHLNPVIQRKAGPRPLIGIAAMGLGVQLATLLVVAPSLGVTGAGIASFVSGVIVAILMIVVADRHLRSAETEKERQ